MFLKILMLVNWPVHRVQKFNSAILNPDQVVSGESYWFFKYWPSSVTVDVMGIQKSGFLYTLEKPSKVHLQFLKTFNRIKNYDLILSFDSPSAFLFSLLRSKIGFQKAIPHILIDVGMPIAVERFLKDIPPNLVCRLLKQAFNPNSVSHIIFHSSCQRPFYRDVLGFSDDALSFVPFGVETDYFRPKRVKNEGYIYTAGEFRDFNTLIDVYERWHKELPELRLRTALPPPNYLPPKVHWLPRASIATFVEEALKSKFVVVPLHNTIRSVGLMTCLQSMALGKAVLTSNVPPITDYVINGKTALYYDPYDVEDLYKKIITLLKDAELLQTLARTAREEVVANFTIEKMGINLWECISGLLKRL